MAYPLAGNITIRMPQGVNGVTGASGTSYTQGTGLTYSTVAGGNWTNAAAWNNPNPKVNITDSDIVLDGRSLRDFMEEVGDRLAILVPNPELEKDFEQLKNLKDQYETLEAELLEKAKAWDTLKK